MNLIEIQRLNNIKLLNVDDEIVENVIYTIESDTRFLQKHNLMDYSLLIQIEKVSSGQKLPETKNRNIIQSVDGKRLYHIGIIDFLQDFSYAKKIESFIKTTKAKGEQAKLISCVHPDFYAQRFLKFMKENVFFYRQDQTVLNISIDSQASVKKKRTWKSFNMMKQA